MLIDFDKFSKMTLKTFKYKYRYCNQHQLCNEHGLREKTLERWISEEKDKGLTIPGRIKIPGVRSYIWEPEKFHDEFLIPKLFGPVRNEYEKQEHIIILNNLKQQQKEKTI